MKRLALSFIFICALVCFGNSLPVQNQAAFFGAKPAGGGGGGSACSSVVTGISGLVRYWALDAGSGTSAVDSSGNSATGTLVGSPTWLTPGKAGAHALTFPTRADYVSTSATVALESMTYAAWVNGSDLSGQSGHNIIMSTDVDNSWIEIDGSGHPSYHSFNNEDFTDTSTTITTGSWHHIAATMSGTDGNAGTVKLYVDGVLKLTASGTCHARTHAVYISTYAPSPGNYGFVGSIDEVVVFNRALTQSEITSIATCN